jgi:Zn-dependent M28 family amino/carboxypeptidase
MKGIIILIVLFSIGVYPQNVNSALDAINEEAMRRHVEILSSDEFMGRQPSTEGEEKTINYLRSEFEKLGLKGGNRGSFFQEVPLVEINTGVDETMNIITERGGVRLKHRDEFVANSAHLRDSIIVEDADLVFAGYGIVAPEYNWNDFEGLDVKGKIIVVLINDPGYATKDENLFTGRSMTYYGRWTYKYEEASRQGAAGCLIIHETGAASYPWEVVRNGWTGPQFYLVSDDDNLSKAKMEGWINNEKGRELFEHAGLNFDSLIVAASQKGFRGVDLKAKLTFRMKNEYVQSVSNNVAALWEGGSRKDEFIIYSAHWDHFGVDSTLEGDQVYSGARDNATGTGALIALAEAFTKLPERQERSVLFLAVTAEEQGLLGSKYYAGNPLYPLNKSVAVINMDALNIFGRMRDMTIVGYGKSELDEYVRRAAEEQNRIVKGDPKPEAGTFYRSDHFSFAKKGVPALYARGGTEHLEKGEEWAVEKMEEYTKEHYHKPSDRLEGWWNFAGMVEDIQLLFKVGVELSNTDHFPNWREGEEFRALRDKQMGQNKK